MFRVISTPTACVCKCGLEERGTALNVPYQSGSRREQRRSSASQWQTMYLTTLLCISTGDATPSCMIRRVANTGDTKRGEHAGPPLAH